MIGFVRFPVQVIGWFHPHKWVLKYLGLAYILLSATNVFSQAPEVIKLDSVSVLPNNSIIIGWSYLMPVENGFTEVHRRLDNGLYAVIARVPVNQTFFIDNGVSGANKAYSYYLVAYDNANNVIGRSDNDAHQTIFLMSPEANICNANFELRWQNYSLSTTVNNPVIVPSPFNEVLIFASYDNGPFLMVDEFSSVPDETVVNTEQSGHYCFFIRARQSGSNISASSNVQCAELTLPSQPSFLQVRFLSVNENNDGAEINLWADDQAPGSSVVIERFDNTLHDFTVLTNIPTLNSSVTFADPNPAVASQSQVYRFRAMDGCGKEVINSGPIATLYLDAFSASSQNIQLAWNTYDGWDRGVDRYIIQRKSLSTGPFIDIGSVNGNLNSFSEIINENDLASGQLYYRIIAVEAPGNPFGFTDSAMSNTKQVSFDAEVFLPTAFKPSSNIDQNRVFKPVFTFFHPDVFKLLIFNRWGQRVYLIENTGEYWDGTINGENADAGVYSWVLNYVDARGNARNIRGTVLLMR